jgi:hypothetical protein
LHANKKKKLHHAKAGNGSAIIPVKAAENKASGNNWQWQCDYPSEIQRGNYQRLVNHVNQQRIPAEERNEARGQESAELGQPESARAPRIKGIPDEKPRKENAEPGEQWDIINCGKSEGHEAKPEQPGKTEARALQRKPCGKGKHAEDCCGCFAPD